MRIKSTVAGLTHGVGTAVSLARRPLSTAANAAGLLKGTAQASFDLLRGRSVEQTPAKSPAPGAAPGVPTEPSPVERLHTTEPETPAEDVVADTAPREPQVVPKPVPTIEELPEPIVIHADDAAGESFHTEPKAASRDSEHGGAPGDREEAEGYVEEIPETLEAGEPEAAVVWTSESTGAERV